MNCHVSEHAKRANKTLVLLQVPFLKTAFINKKMTILDFIKTISLSRGGGGGPVPQVQPAVDTHLGYNIIAYFITLRSVLFLHTNPRKHFLPNVVF